MVSANANDRSRGRRMLTALFAFAVIESASALARAGASPTDRGAAEVLFNDAKQLVAQGKFAEACPKFAESQRLDAGIGTMLYLADCYEKNGQTASAWIEFREAASAAKVAGQADREKKARERAAALEPKISRLAVGVTPGAEVAGLELRRDGEIIGKPLWGTAVPLDPGEHLIEARAPGKKSWQTRVQLPPEASAPVVVEAPALEAAPATPSPPNGTGVASAPAAPAAFVKGNTVRIAGYTAMGVGVASAAVGGALGLLAIRANQESNDIVDSSDVSANGKCRPNNACGAEGERLRHNALLAATGSTIGVVAGAVLFTGGLVTILVARGSAGEAKKTGLLGVSPAVGPGQASLWLRGAF
jgi:hypothetical protein